MQYPHKRCHRSPANDGMLVQDATVVQIIAYGTKKYYLIEQKILFHHYK